MNDPLNKAKLIATDTQSTVRGGRVLLGTFTLSIAVTSVTLFTGDIVELVRYPNAGGEVRTSDTKMVAGQGYAQVRAAERERSKI